MNKIASIFIMFALVISAGIIFFGISKLPNKTDTTNGAAQNGEIKNGVQYITVKAKGGYSPKVSTAKSGIPTKLIIKTDGTYDCSASLVIRQLGFQKILSQTGEEIIDIGVPNAGKTLQGICGMGMYNFLIKFI